MKCEIIKDLLPSYIEGLTSVESNSEIENHLEGCAQCRETLEAMKSEIITPNIEINKKNIKPFKKLNKKVIKAVLITLVSCVFIFGIYMFLFGFGWNVQSDEITVAYSNNNEVITVDFELKNSNKALNYWSHFDKNMICHIKFTECYVGCLDDRGDQPNRFSYGINYKDETGKQRILTDKDYLVIQYKDKTEKLYWKEIAEELGLQ